MKFRKKPVVIDAVHWTGDNIREILDFCPEAYWNSTRGLVIRTLESNEHQASVGDWVIKGVQGEFYACKPDIFAATYEPAE